MKKNIFASTLLLTCSLSVVADNQPFHNDNNLETNQVLKSTLHQK